MLLRMFIDATFSLFIARASTKHVPKTNDNYSHQQESEGEFQGKKTAIAFSSSTQIETTTLVPPDQICAAYMLFDSISKLMEKNDHNFKWSDACAPFEALNYQICPQGDYLRDVCLEPHYGINMNHSDRYEYYCKPIFNVGIAEGKDRDDCIRACLKYISRGKGDCCKFECP